MKLNKLEALRGFASVYVALTHWLLSLPHIPFAILLFLKFGQEAVIIFFILSGFVIYYAYERDKESSLGVYFIKRFRRIYFPFLCAILVSIFFVDFPFDLKTLIGNLLMLQDFATGKPGNIVTSFSNNRALWSLSYEWTFYLLFPFVYPVIKNYKTRVHYIGIFCVLNLLIYILFPNHLFLVLSYFIIWWTGLEAGAYFFGNRDGGLCKTLFLYYIIILMMLATTSVFHYKATGKIEPGMYPYLVIRHFGFAFICLLMTVYFNTITQKLIGLLKPFAYVAPISYAIYVLHYPILIQSHFNLPAYLEIPTKFGLLIGLAYLIEVVLQPVVNKYLTIKSKITQPGIK